MRVEIRIHRAVNMADARAPEAVIDNVIAIIAHIGPARFNIGADERGVAGQQFGLRRDRVDDQRDLVAMAVNRIIIGKLIDNADFHALAGPALIPLRPGIGIAAGNRQAGGNIQRRMGGKQ